MAKLLSVVQKSDLRMGRRGSSQVGEMVNLKSIDTCDFGSINCGSMWDDLVWGLAADELMNLKMTESEMIQTR